MFDVSDLTFKDEGLHELNKILFQKESNTFEQTNTSSTICQAAACWGSKLFVKLRADSFGTILSFLIPV